jgi:uncharacterized protein with ParB-like and HNH nuclease domain
MAGIRLEFDLAGIGSVLANRRLSVPIYQRPYAWGSEDPKERDQVTEFWSDLGATFNEPALEYFLGTIVLSGEGSQDRVTIIDGQQRLATTAILLAAIRDEFRTRGDAKRGNIVNDTYLAKADLRTASQVPQLTLNADDDSFFRAFVLDGRHEFPPTTGSHELLKRAYEVLRDDVKTTADDAAGTWAERLYAWVEYLKIRVRVGLVEVPTEADAFLIFETLNDRGADLTIADLLKNYLFRRAEDRLDVVRNAWVTALANLDISAAGSQLFTDFLRHYWSSKYGATRERELYARIKEKISTSSNAVDFAEELQVASRLYAAIIHGDHEFWSEHSTAVKTNVGVLGTLNLEQNRPLLLAVMQHFAPQELAATLRRLVSWSVRSLVVGGIGGGTTERIYCEAAMKVRTGAAKSAPEVAKALARIMHRDDEFRDSFSRLSVTRGSLARYMLAAMERTELGKSEPELVPNEDESVVNLEHVLPRNPTATDWPPFDDDQRRAYLHRVGNMALLSKGPNGRIGNKPFAFKKPILAQSQLRLTQAAGAEPDWTPAIIDARQKKLADLAVRTWTP